MKFLITGGTGLIGKSIVQLLIEKNHHINVLSRKRGEDTKQVRYYQWVKKIKQLILLVLIMLM